MYPQMKISFCTGNNNQSKHRDYKMGENCCQLSYTPLANSQKSHKIKYQGNTTANQQLGKLTENAVFKTGTQMSNNCFKNCSIFIKERQIKYSMHFPLMPVRMAIIKKSDDKCWRWSQGKGIPICSCRGCVLMQSLWKLVWSHLKH